jgi:hypothetical protein
MKKTYSFLFTLALLLLPLQVLAAVDITLTDNSTTDIKSISITLDTDTDTVESVTIPIQFSEGVEISEVNSGTITCSSLEYVDTSDTVTVTCELDEAMALDGVLANILFTSEDESYTFTVVEDATLEIGDLEVGETVNIGETVVEEDEIVTEEESTDLLTPEPSLTTIEESTTEDSGFSIDNLTEYLPYILIAGSVVLLISIIGILLSRKKSSTEFGQETVTEQTPPTPQSEPTLKDMVNKTEVTTEQPQTVETVQSVPPTPVTQPDQQPLQPTPQQQEIPTPMPPQMEQPTPVAAGTVTEEKDLQEIMQQESPSIQPETNIPTPTPIPTATTTPENVIPETNTPPTAQDLQNSINNEIQNLATETPTPPVQPVQEAPTAEELPPVPPTM